MTPDNGSYAIAAYTLTALVYVGYALFVAASERRLRARLEKLDASGGSRPTEEA